MVMTGAPTLVACVLDVECARGIVMIRTEGTQMGAHLSQRYLCSWK